MNDLSMLMLGLSGGGSSSSENLIQVDYYSGHIIKDTTHGDLGADNWKGRKLYLEGTSWVYYLLDKCYIRVALNNPTLDSEGRLEVASTNTFFNGVLPCIYCNYADGIEHIGSLYFYYKKVYLIPTTELPTGTVKLMIKTGGAIGGNV